MLPYVSCLVGLMVGVGWLSGCASARQDGRVSVTPERTVLLPDSAGVARLDVQFSVPAGYMTRRERLVIAPQLVVDGALEKEMFPLVVDAPIYEKKLARRKALEDYRDPGEPYKCMIDSCRKAFVLDYREAITIPDDFTSGLVRAVVSTDGCGECTGLDTIHIANVGNLSSLIDLEEAFAPQLITPDYVVRPKLGRLQVEAVLQFAMNRYLIEEDRGDNREALEHMSGVLRSLLSDSLATVDSITVYGMASADGPYLYNSRLARNRALSAERWLVKNLSLSAEMQQKIRVDSRPEGWWPVYEAMAGDGHADTLGVKQILLRYTQVSDDVQERYIRRLPCWPDIRNRYLSHRRRVEYVCHYTIRNFLTDEELKAMYRSRPDAFSVDEFLRLATLAESDSLVVGVYDALLSRFPQSPVAAYNRAVFYFRDSLMEKSRQMVYSQKESLPEMTDLLAACCVQEKEYEQAIALLRNAGHEQARYRLGVLLAYCRRYDEAYRLLKGYDDLNCAIVALCLGRNDEAAAMMERIGDTSPLAEYIRAVVAARAGDERAFWLHIEKACLDETLSRRACDEPDFGKYLAGKNPADGI